MKLLIKQLTLSPTLLLLAQSDRLGRVSDLETAYSTPISIELGPTMTRR